MIDMNDFRYFVTIVDKGSFTNAGHALGLPTSTLSYRIKQLEERLGIVLLLRNSRRLSVTEAGTEFYRHALATVENADEAEQAMRNRLSDPSGTLRFTTATAVAQFVMPEIINSFMLMYPKITLVQHAVDHFVDIVGERFDLAIRAHTNALPNSNLIQKSLAHIPWYLFASPSYLSASATVDTPQDLARHPILFFRRENAHPRFSLSNHHTGSVEEVAISPRLWSSCMAGLKDAAKAGLGITALPAYLCSAEMKSGELKLILPDWLAEDTSLTALMPHRIGLCVAVRAFIDHVANSCQEVIDHQAMLSAA